MGPIVSSFHSDTVVFKNYFSIIQLSRINLHEQHLCTMPWNIIGLCAPLWTTTLLTICKLRNSRPNAARCQELLTSTDQPVATGAELQVIWPVINRLLWSMLVNLSQELIRMLVNDAKWSVLRQKSKLVGTNPQMNYSEVWKMETRKVQLPRAFSVFSLVRTAAKINFTYKILILAYYNSTYTHYNNYIFYLIFGILI